MSQLSITSKILRLRIEVRYVGDHESGSHYPLFTRLNLTHPIKTQ
jgi:hypothetical protein